MVKKDKTEPNLPISTKSQQLDSKASFRFKKTNTPKFSPSGESLPVGLSHLELLGD